MVSLFYQTRAYKPSFTAALSPKNFCKLEKLNNYEIFDNLGFMRQNYSKETLQGIVDQFKGLGIIKNSHLFTSGFENSNYYVETEKGRFVVKVFEGADIMPENILFEIEMMDRLSNAGAKTPKIFHTMSGKLHVALGEKYAILMNFIEGKNMEMQTISDILAKQIGEQAAKWTLLCK
ncbi:phosphotransferase [Candidatus Peregrinibacteria bacterium]|nr:MAG: phosphotransferase [Candidatus Peregrinibacteria bacterium]